MNKFLMAGIVATMAAATSVATASPLVTANVPLSADITDISTNWKEWVISRHADRHQTLQPSGYGKMDHGSTA